MEHGSHSAWPFLWQCKNSQKVDSVSTMGRAVSKIKVKSNAFLREKSRIPYFFTSSLPGFIFTRGTACMAKL